jgi:hypothetical protein
MTAHPPISLDPSAHFVRSIALVVQSTFRPKTVDNKAAKSRWIRMKNFFQHLVMCSTVILAVGCGRTPDAEPPSTNTQTEAPKPTHAVYSLEWVTNDIPPTMPAGKAVPVHVSVKNTGDWPWPDPFAANPAKPDGTYAIRLSYLWADSSGKLAPQDSARGELPAPVPPGQIANFTMQVVAPKAPGSYQLQLDLVEELNTFFVSKGTTKLTVPVAVQ